MTTSDAATMPNEAATPEALPPARAILYSHGCRFGYLEGGPEDGLIFLRNWNSSQMRSKGRRGVYVINRQRVERKGRDSAYCVIFEYREPACPNCGSAQVEYETEHAEGERLFCFDCAAKEAK